MLASKISFVSPSLNILKQRYFIKFAAFFLESMIKFPAPSKLIPNIEATILLVCLSLTLSMRSDFSVMNVLLDVYCEAYVLKDSTSEKAFVATIASIAIFFTFAIVFSISNSASKLWLNKNNNPGNACYIRLSGAICY